MDEHHEEGLLGWLDSPRLVVGAFAFFVLGLTVLGILLWTDQREQTQRLDEIVQQRLVEEQAAKENQVAGCFQRAAQGPALRRLLDELERSAEPRLRMALLDYRALNALNTPTFRECRQLARSLGVEIPRGVR